MRRGLSVGIGLCALVALSCAAFASAAGEARPTGLWLGEPLEFGADAKVSPRSISASTREPLRVELKGRVDTNDGSRTPALTGLVLEADRNLTVDPTGIPTCDGGGRRPRDPDAMEAICGPAIIGRGELTLEAAFPENHPITLSSELLLINAGVSGGTINWFAYAYFNAPISGEVFFPVAIRKHRDGRYGTRAVATIPELGDGYISVRRWKLAIAKNVKGEDGKTRHPITGRCADGKLRLGVEANFAGGDERLVEIQRPCTPKG